MRRRLLAAAMVFPLLWAALCAVELAPALAQIGGPPLAPVAPLRPPPPPPGAQPQAAPAGAAPAAPGAPAAVSTTGTTLQLAPAPAVVATPQAATSAQIFRCSCFGNGLGTQWVGTVQSTSFVLAGQSAQRQCMSYNLNANPPTSYMPPQSSTLASNNPYPVVSPYAAPGNVLNPYRGITPQPGGASNATLQQLAIAGLCSRCACN